MMEMQGIRMMHCTIWTEGVREIVSQRIPASSSSLLITLSRYTTTLRTLNIAYVPSGDLAIALKASQTIFPLNRDFCLILSNLEYVQNPTTKPLEKRTAPRNFRNSMVRTDAFIRTRRCSDSMSPA